MRVWEVDFSDILLHEKLYKEKFENILIDHISYKTSTAAKPLRIWYNKIEGFIKIQDRIRYLVLIDCGWFDKTCDRMKYLISEKYQISEIVLYLISEKYEISEMVLRIVLVIIS